MASICSYKKISIFFPLISALGTLIERCHGFIGRSDLYLHKVRLQMTALRTPSLNSRLIHVLPGLCATQHIVYFFTLEMHFLLEGLVDNEDIRACFAEESEVTRRLLC